MDKGSNNYKIFQLNTTIKTTDTFKEISAYAPNISETNYININFRAGVNGTLKVFFNDSQEDSKYGTLDQLAYTFAITANQFHYFAFGAMGQEIRITFEYPAISANTYIYTSGYGCENSIIKLV